MEYSTFTFYVLLSMIEDAISFLFNTPNELICVVDLFFFSVLFVGRVFCLFNSK